MSGLTGLISKLLAVFFLVPSSAFAISLDSQRDNVNSFGIEKILTIQSWDSLDNQKLDCRKILQRRVRDPAINACVAAQEMKRQQWQDASKYWQVALENYQKNDSIKAGYYLGLVLSELKRNNVKSAQKAAQKALSFAPNSIPLRYWLARSFEFANNQTKAASEYEKITAITPSQKAWLEQYYHATAIVKTGKQKRYAYAKNELLTFLKHNPSYYNGIALLAYLELLLGDTASAIKNLNRADRLIPLQPFVQRLLSQAYLITGDLDSAIFSGKRLLRIKPKDVTGNYLVGAAYLKRGDTDKGIIYMNRVSSLEPAIKEAKILLAVSYLSNGQAGKAKTIVDELVKENVSNLATEVSLLNVLSQLGRYEEVVSRSNIILKTHTEPLVSFLQAKALSKLGKVTDAEKLLQNLVRDQPKFQPAYIELSRVYMMQTQFSNADFLLKKALVKWPSSVPAYILKGDLMIFLKKPELALKAYNKATQIDANSRIAWKKYLQYLVQRSLLNDASRVVEKVIKLHPEFADGYFFKAVIAYVKKDNVVAKKMFEETLALKPSYYKALNHLGLLALNDANISIEYFKKSLAINVRQPVIYAQLAGQYLVLDDQANFSKVVKQWQAEFPKSSMPYEYLGKAYRKLSDFKQAATALKEAIKRSPEKSVNYLILGDTYKQVKNFKQGILLYKTALEVFPDAPVFLNNLAGSYVGDLQYENALNASLKAEKFAPNSWKIKDTVAWVYFLKGDYSSAIEKYEQALAMSENSLLAFRLAKVYDKAGEAGKARRYFDMARKNQSMLSSEDKIELKKRLGS